MKIRKLFMRYFVLFLLSFSVYAQTQFIMMPSYSDLDRLSVVFELSNEPFPVHLVYDGSNNKLEMLGIAMNHKIRNGVHGRLITASGLVQSLADAKYTNHQYYAGTLFLERVNGAAVLSVHGRNSHRSTVNKRNGRLTVKRKIPIEVLKEISEKLHISVLNASKKLDRRIREINEKKYLTGLTQREHSLAYTVNNLSDNTLIKPIRVNSLKRKVVDSFFRRRQSDTIRESLESHPDMVQQILDTKTGHLCSRLLANL